MVPLGKEGATALRESFSEQAGRDWLRVKNVFYIIYSTVSQYIDSNCTEIRAPLVCAL